MLIALNKKQREKQTSKIVEKSAVVVLSIINEIKGLEKELGYSIVDDLRNNKTLTAGTYSDDIINLFREQFNEIIKLSSSVYLPFYICELIKHPDIDLVKSIANIYIECEAWLKANNLSVMKEKD